jgi:hypothetical protein
MGIAEVLTIIGAVGGILSWLYSELKDVDRRLDCLKDDINEIHILITALKREKI